MRLGDTCALCGEAILDVNELVVPRAYPWNMAVGGVAHRDCVNALLRREMGDLEQEPGGLDDEC